MRPRRTERPGKLHEQDHDHGAEEAENGVVEEPNRQEPENQWPRGSPEPEVLVKKVNGHDDAG